MISFDALARCGAAIFPGLGALVDPKRSCLPVIVRFFYGR